MNKKILYFLAILLVSSCNIKKKNIINKFKSPKNASELISKVLSKNRTPEWIAMQGKVNLKSKNKDVRLRINIKIRKDSVILAHISAPFGIEVLRLMITKDSVFYLNRIDRTFLREPISYLAVFSEADISFIKLQNIITSNPIIEPDKYLFNKINDTYEIRSDSKLYKVSSQTYRIIDARIVHNDYQFNYQYSFFPINNGYIFPKKMSASSSSTSDFSFTINYYNIIFNKKQKFVFNIPDSYNEAL